MNKLQLLSVNIIDRKCVACPMIVKCNKLCTSATFVRNIVWNLVFLFYEKNQEDVSI